MEELLKIAYMNFMETEDGGNSGRIAILNKAWEKTEKAREILKDTVSEKIYYEVYDLLYNCNADVQEAAFICGFSYCAKFLTNGKVDFFPNRQEADGV